MMSPTSTTSRHRPVNANPNANHQSMLASLEDRILGLESWGQVLMHLGSSADLLRPDAIAIIGQAVSRASEYLKDDWTNAQAHCVAEARI
ncbi:hypothetical protein OCOJLMKI_3996 [Methylobacterium iners]|uniref:Uncharacterized protein n=1 Tax=Methylobacterium iners TaxID=418707 RepID=A0ABQ4S0Y2_9HYPH|nr:hypothetical protein OCOJLMKI_3996 [Methylobacterium iners]